MLRTVLLGDLRRRFRRPVGLLALGAVVALVALAVRLDIVQEGFATGRAYRNAPIALYRLATLVTQMGAFLFGPVITASLDRDRESGLYHLLFACPLAPGDYFWGKFLAGLATAATLALAMVPGVMVGLALPGVDPSTIGPQAPVPWVAALFVVALPNVFVVAALVFAVAAATRSTASAFAVPLALFAYDLGVITLADRAKTGTLALLEPFGVIAGALATEGWTVAQQNSQHLEMGGIILANRLLWIGIAVAALLAARHRFAFARYFDGGRESRRSRLRSRSSSLETTDPESPVAFPEPPAGYPAVRSLVPLAAAEIRNILRRPATWLIAGGALFFLHIDQMFGHSVLGAPVVPTADRLARVDPFSYGLYLRVAIVLGCGLMMTRWTSRGLDEIFATSPASTSAIVAVRGLAGFAWALGLLLLALPTGVAVELAVGEGTPNLGLYLRHLLLVELPGLVAFVGLSLFVYSLVRGRLLVGATVLLAGWAARLSLPTLGLDHPLLLFGSLPDYTWTRFTGYGPFRYGIAVLQLYWLSVSSVLLLGACLVWPRSTDRGFRSVARNAARRLTSGWCTVAAIALILAAIAGAEIVRGTAALGTRSRQDELSVLYERTYGHRRADLRPRIEHVAVAIDLFPKDGRASAVGTYELTNWQSVALEELHVSLHPRFELRSVELEAAHLSPVEEDPALGFFRYRVSPPLAPGRRQRLRFEVALESPRVPLRSEDLAVIENGTLLGDDVLPVLGYDPGRELADALPRRRAGLPYRNERVDVTRSFAAADAGWLTFDTTLTTSADQFGFAPGRLVAAGSTPDGRRWYRFRSETGVTKALTWISGRYTITSRTCAGGPLPKAGVRVEIAHLPPDSGNLERMLEAACATLDFAHSRFGPYPYDTLRIVEVPGYFQGAFALPGLVVMSESFGFRLRVLGDDDPIFQVVSHEVAHQWWGHQVVPAHGPGARLVGESVAQYVSSEVLARVRGRAAQRAFLERQSKRYLLGRSQSAQREVPLVAVGDTPYIHSGKGALILHGLGARFGNVALEEGLARFIDRYRRTGPPFPLPADLARALEESVPPQSAREVAESLREIVLFDHRLVRAEVAPSAGGAWRVRVEAELAELRGDGDGREWPVPFSGTVALILRADKRELASTLFDGRDGRNRWEVELPELPDRVVLDPDFHYLDRNRSDNSIGVERMEADRSEEGWARE